MAKPEKPAKKEKTEKTAEEQISVEQTQTVAADESIEQENDSVENNEADVAQETNVSEKPAFEMTNEILKQGAGEFVKALKMIIDKLNKNKKSVARYEAAVKTVERMSRTVFVD